jgi:hypothetical protein
MKSGSKNLLLILLLCIFWGINSCEGIDNPPLQDDSGEYITEPSVIKLALSITKSGDMTKYIVNRKDIVNWHNFYLRIYGENENQIKLNGSVFLNDMKMMAYQPYKEDPPYYKLNEPSGGYPYYLDSNYVLKIILSDGSVYESNFQLQDHDLDTTSVSIYQDTATIMWQDRFQSNDIQIFYSRSNYIDGPSLYQDTLTVFSPDTIGSVKISMSGFKYFYYEMKSTVIRSLNPPFRVGSTVTSVITVTNRPDWWDGL